MLWKKTMGERVLRTSVRSAAVDGAAGPWLRAYAHCSPVALGGRDGGVSLLLINTHSKLPVNVSVAGLGGGHRVAAAAGMAPDSWRGRDGDEQDFKSQR